MGRGIDPGVCRRQGRVGAVVKGGVASTLAQGVRGVAAAGLETPENHFFTIVDSQSVPVGTLWFAVKTKFDAKVAYVFDVGVRPERQREGHAMRAFSALEEQVRSLGLTGIALHVFGRNTAARALYEKLGFQPTNISLFRPVEP